MVLTALSRVTGLVRDGVLSRIFGASNLMSAFWFAFLIPNLFRRLFGEGALSASFLPVYARLHDEDPRRAGQLASCVRRECLSPVVFGVGEFCVLPIARVGAVSASAG